MPGLNLIGSYHYSGTTIDGRKYSIIRNDGEILRVLEVSDHERGVIIWQCSMPMTTEIMDIIKHERCNGA